MSDTIPQAVVEELKFYVYRLVDPRTGETFYVGKGSGQRVLQHRWDALDDPLPTDRLDRIREIRAAGMEEALVIHRHAMDEATALHVEAAVMAAYPRLTNLVAGHGAEFGPAGLAELVDRYAAPDARIAVPAILIKIEKEWRPDLSPEQLYERTRRYWRCDPARRRPPPTHAVSVARGLVREVYRIERWDAYTEPPPGPPGERPEDAAKPWRAGQLRRAFVGRVCGELASLKRCSVRHLAFGGAQNPVACVNC